MKKKVYIYIYHLFLHLSLKRNEDLSREQVKHGLTLSKGHTVVNHIDDGLTVTATAGETRLKSSWENLAVSVRGWAGLGRGENSQ